MFCDIIKNLRKEKSLSQQAIANYLQITRQAYSNYENGKREPDYETLLKLSEFFGVTVDYLTRGEMAETLTAPEQQLLDLFRQLNDEGQQKIIGYAADIVQTGSYKKTDTNSVGDIA